MAKSAKYPLLAALAVACAAQAAQGCSIELRTVAEQRADNSEAIRESKPVAMGADCSFVNGGLSDHFSGGPAITLGKERFYQVLDTEAGQVVDAMVVDCNVKKVTRVMSGYIKNENYAEDSCGGEHGDRFPLLGAKGALTLQEGKTLEEFEQFANETGKVVVDGSLTELRLDWMGKRLPKKERVDFLCGCRRLYPNSNGGRS